MGLQFKLRFTLKSLLSHCILYRNAIKDICRLADVQAQILPFNSDSGAEETLSQDRNRNPATSHYVAAPRACAPETFVTSSTWLKLCHVPGGRKAADLLFVNPRRHS